MQHLKKYQPFSKLTQSERDLVLNHFVFSYKYPISSTLKINLDYILGVEVDDTPESKVLVANYEDLQNYLRSIHKVLCVSKEKLTQCNDIFMRFLTTPERSKIPIQNDTPMPIYLDDVKHVVTSKKPIMTKTFPLGVCEGLMFSINTFKVQQVGQATFVLDKTMFEQLFWKLSQSKWTEIQSEAQFVYALNMMSNQKEYPHCVLYGALRFFQQERRLPYNNQKDLYTVWSLISSKYSPHPTDKNKVKTPTSTFSFEDVWKQYSATYSKHLLTYLTNDPL